MRSDSPTHLLLLVLLLSALVPICRATVSCNGTKDVMVTAAFVDIYSAGSTVVLATPDGGAVFAAMMTETGNPRVVKVDAEAKVKWFSEARAAGASEYAWYTPRALVEDPTGPYIYLSGYTSTGQGFVIKYAEATGSYIASAVFRKDSEPSAINSMILDSGGNLLVFAGTYGNSPFHTWSGAIDKSSLIMTEHVPVSSYSDYAVFSKVVQDSSGSYAFAGTIWLSDIPYSSYIWLALVDRATWSMTWESYYSSSVHYTSMSGGIRSLLAVSTGVFAILADESFYKVVSGLGFALQADTFGMYGAAVSALDSDKFLLAGAHSLTTSSMAYVFDPTASCRYDQGEMAQFKRVEFYGLSRDQNYGYAWATGIARDRYSAVAAVVKLKEETALVCNTASTNYMNKACYPSLAASNCFGLCSACLISDDMNACVSGTFGAHRYALGLFAGRCAQAGYHYKAVTMTCAPVIQTNCHPLCGGECIAASDPTQCAHHCNGADPYIDDSMLATNVCGCRPGSAYSAVAQGCVSGCFLMCHESEGDCAGMHISGESCICETSDDYVRVYDPGEEAGATCVEREKAVSRSIQYTG